MRRKLDYSTHVVPANRRVDIGSLPQGGWHVSKTGGRLFVGDTSWKCYVRLGEMTDEAEFHLDKTTSMLMQAQDGTTCRDIAIESKPAYDIYVVGGGASELLHRADRAVLTLRRVTADETRESKHACDQAPHPHSFRGADGRTDLYRHGRRSAFASMGQYFARCADDRHVFRDSHGHVIRRYPDERDESDHRGWRGHHARNKRMVGGTAYCSPRART